MFNADDTKRQLLQVIDVLAAIRDLKNDYPTTYKVFYRFRGKKTTYKGNRLVKQKEIVYGQLACERSWILNYNIHYQKVKSKLIILLNYN